MGRAYQCDRCGHYESGEALIGVTVRYPKPETTATRDEDVEFCPDCLTALYQFIGNEIGYPYDNY